jgi:hypothetical protein
MPQETRALGAEELIEKVIPGTRMSKESVERQMFKKIKTGKSHEDFYVSYRDLLYVVDNASIRSYFEGKSAPVLSSGAVPKAERLGEALPDSAAAADKAKDPKRIAAAKKAAATRKANAAKKAAAKK